jgi:kynurenine formamidase
MFVLLSYKIDCLTPIYGGRKGFFSESASSIESGDTANTSKWEFPNHIGTHIDFPYHFYQNGQTIDDFAEKFWIFSGKKIQILEVNLPEKETLIGPQHIKGSKYNVDTEFLILKTNSGTYRHEEKYWMFNPGLSIQFCDWAINNFKKLRIIGIDSISISSWQQRDIGRKAHKKLLNPKNPILIIEDMNLSPITADTIFKILYVAPLFVSKSDGTPCTIFAEVKRL